MDTYAVQHDIDDNLSLVHDEDCLDISKEEMDLKTINDTIVDLQNIYHELEMSAGVNVSLAMAMESAYPGILPSYMPTESFTKDNSLTNYKASMEVLVLGTAAALLAAMAALYVIVKKIVGWIKSMFFKSAQKQKQNAVIIENCRKLLKEISGLAPDQTIANKIATESADEFKNISNELTNDIVDTKKAEKALVKVGDQVDKYIELISKKQDIYDEALKIAIKNSTDGAEAAVAGKLGDTFKAVQTDTKTLTSGVKSSISVLLNSSSKENNIDVTLKEMKDKVTAMVENKAVPALDYISLINTLFPMKITAVRSLVEWKLVDKFVPDIDRTKNNVEKLEKKIEKHDKKVEAKVNGGTLIDLLKDSADVIKKEVAGLQSFISMCTIYTNNTTEIAMLLNKYVTKHYQETMASKSQRTPPPPEVIPSPPG